MAVTESGYAWRPETYLKRGLGKFCQRWLRGCKSDLPMKTATLASLLAAALMLGLPLEAQQWSIGVSTGPFVFGDFMERRMKLVNDAGPEDQQTLTLSAATRPGLSVDLERSLGERWALRLEGTFTRSPLSVRQSGTDGAEIDAGELDVATFMLPVVFRVNPRGTFRFHVLAGPALGTYSPHNRATAPFRGTRNEAGVAFGGGVAWTLNDRFAIEGNLTDTITTSPFRDSDFPDVPGITTPKPHNVHTTIGLRWRF